MIPVGRDESRPVAESKTFGPEELPVAGTAMNLLVGAVTRQHGVQRSMTFGAIEALFVPHGALGELLLRGEHHAATTGTALSSWRLNRSRIGIVERSTGRNLFLPVIQLSYL